eukprot:6189679-Pleurochrysis_carterae.AAC.1
MSSYAKRDNHEIYVVDMHIVLVDKQSNKQRSSRVFVMPTITWRSSTAAPLSNLYRDIWYRGAIGIALEAWWVQSLSTQLVFIQMHTHPGWPIPIKYSHVRTFVRDRIQRSPTQY